MTIELDPKKATLNLVLATLASTVGFWGWMVISPLGARYTENMGLSSTSISVLVAMPILVGSLGRIVVGSMTDRFGGKVMFTGILGISVVPVLGVAWAGSVSSYWLLLVSAFFLGIAGTVFAIGIPFVSAWYKASRRGFATGVFGMGMGGTAIAAFMTPRLTASIGYVQTHLLVAALMAVMAVVVWFTMSESPARVPVVDPFIPKVMGAARLPVTWQMTFLYAVVFGGFVSFCAYLPTYLRDIYDMNPTAAGTRTAGFALAAVIVRPIGGILADKIGPKPVVIVSLIGVTVLALVVMSQPQTEVATGATFLSMASALGLGMGGVFAWVGRLAPAKNVGAVTGIVAAGGGLGGYFPPMVMGATYNPVTNSYGIGLFLLAITAAVALVVTLFLQRKSSEQAKSAPANNPG
ncbi:nitrate/nitrite transporter [Paeniglutamicibacter sp. R2-26]|uniref:nitrate/nitrite transporter n=1 Tax=Paeniglutamicibacter sp. R2-26 TaxID=3144417 RepID=UPI003EE701E9